MISRIETETETERLYRFHHSRISAIGRRSAMSDDCTQEIWLKLLKAKLPFEERDENKNLIARIAYRASCSFHEKNGRSTSVHCSDEIASVVVDDTHVPDKELLRAESIDRVRQILATLKPAEHAIAEVLMEMTTPEEYTDAEGIDPSTARKRIHDFRKRYKPKFERLLNERN